MAKFPRCKRTEKEQRKTKKKQRKQDTKGILLFQPTQNSKAIPCIYKVLTAKQPTCLASKESGHHAHSTGRVCLLLARENKSIVQTHLHKQTIAHQVHMHQTWLLAPGISCPSIMTPITWECGGPFGRTLQDWKSAADWSSLRSARIGALRLARRWLYCCCPQLRKDGMIDK